MQISVVIPTFNRYKILKECIFALFKQDLSQEDFEIIVVDDGSVDDTRKMVEDIAKSHVNVRYFYQRNAGQGIARNHGISKALGKIIVLIGDDIIAMPNFLTEHLRYHLKYPNESDAVLGFIDWHPHLTVTPFMRWLTNGSSIFGRFGGHQFAYEKLDGKDIADYNFFYTSNISLKSTLLKRYGFDPAFSAYGWEDIELGYRLFKQAGMRLLYNRKAIAYHDHAISEAAFKARMRDIGRSAWIIHAKYPELKKVPSRTKLLLLKLLAHPLIIWFFKQIRNMSQGRWCSFYYYALSKKCFLEGLESDIIAS